MTTGRASRGTVLVLVLVVVAILSVVAASEMFLIRSEVGAQAAALDGQQARAAAMSGIHRAMSVLMTDRHNPDTWRDNPDLFQAQPLSGDDDAEWLFTVYAPSRVEPGSIRYGLIDEAGKININIATPEVLNRLPGMNEELVDCLLDFRDGDSDTRTNGAEQEYYDGLAKPYKINNSLLGTVEELLLIKGFDGTIVYGEDANRNGAMEPNEDDSDESFPPDNRDGRLDPGLAALATTVSYEPDVDNEGNPRININTTSPDALMQVIQQVGLPPETAEFISLARKNNTTFSDPSQLLGMTLEVPDPQDPRQKKQISSGVDRENIDVVMDKLTCGSVPTGGGRMRAGRQGFLFGRVNLSSAPRQVVSALPGLDESAAQRIADARAGLDAEARSTTAWIYAHDLVSSEVFKKVAPFVTARSYQFRVRSLGYSRKCGRFCVLEAVIDLARGGPRITYLRELTRLGVPLETSGQVR